MPNLLGFVGVKHPVESEYSYTPLADEKEVNLND